MAQDLASLVIGLRADVATLQSDLGKANALNARYARDASDTWTKAAGEIGTAIGAAVAAAGAIFATLAKNSIDTADQFQKMSQKVGISVETLSALNVQAKLSDVSIESLQGALGKLAKNAADAAGGSKQQAAAFQAIGVSVKDAAGNLKPMDTLLADVSTKFASYRDSAAKTALAQEYFGKSGAELIPLLNQLGEQGFAKAREEAEKYGAVISGDTAKASEQFNDNLTKLKVEVGGFANAVTAQLLPGLNKLTESMIAAGQTTDRYGGSATMLADAIKGLVAGLITVKEFLSAVATTTFAFYDAVKTTFEAAGAVVAAFGQAAYQSIKGAFSLDPQAMADARANLSASLSKIGGDVAKSFTGIKDALGGGIAQNIANVKTTLTDLFGTFANVSSGADTTAKAMGNLNAPIVANTDSTKAYDEALQKLNDTQIKAAQFIAQLTGKVSPADQIMQNWVNTILQTEKIASDLADAYAKVGRGAEGEAAAEKFAAQAVAAANQVRDQANEKLARQADIVGRLRQEFENQASLIGLTDREKAIAEAVQKATEEFTKNTEAGITNAQTLDTVQKAAAGGAAAIFDMSEKAKNSQDIARQFTSIWVSSGDSIADAFSKWVVEGGSLMKSLTSIAKQVVEQIIAYFMKLAVINPILNAIFGSAITAGGGSMLPTMMDAGGGIMSAFFGGAGSSGGSSVMSEGGGLMTAGQTMWQGFKNGFTSFFGPSQVAYSQGLMGTYTNPGAFGGPLAGGGTYTPSTLGYGVAAAGGVYAGYNEYQRSGSLIGGAAYGYGTYAASIGVSAALAGGISAGLAAIPVVGWIAIAAMLIDKFSGGKLFGTKGTMQEGSTTLNIGAGGADFANQISLKGQKALFGGAKWSTQDIAESPEQKEAAQAFFDSMTKTMKQYADQFGVKAGELVSASFQQVFDKHGKLTGETHATIAGYNYDNLTQDQFAQAYVAANELAVLDQFDSKLEATIATYRKSADTLVEIATGLTHAQGYLQSGGDFLAVAGKDTLSSIVTLAEGMQQAGETIDQTIDRLIQAQQQYDQFVGQFKPPKNYVDDFEATLAGINDQMTQNIATANALAKAAGAAGASEQDLANIHQYAARQMAAAIQQLEASAQSLAFNLGLTTTGSLDQVNSEIERLQAKQNAGHAIRDFGQAMQDAAQKAKDAMALLLGSLSPYNDQQKLQFALSGLRSGTTTKDQVLEIGRRLYASSQAYTDLFNQVQSMPTASQNAAGIGGGSGGGLTGAESTRLQMLLKQQQQLQAAAQLQQYQTLAQQIAEIASAKGEDWQQVVKDMGIDLKAFEKGLGMNDKQLNDYITSIQKQTDSDGNNTKSIIDAINAMSDAVVTALGGTPRPHDPSSGPVSLPYGNRTPPGHSGHGRAITDDDANAIGQSVGRNIRDVVFGNVRNQRTRQTINAT